MLKHRLLCDFQVPDFLEDLRLDADHLLAQAAEMGAQAITFVCKNAFGNCLYRSRVGYTHPVVANGPDIAGAVRRLAARYGIEFVAYYNMLLDDHLATEHPEWKQTGRDSMPLKSFGYHVFCMNAEPYAQRVREHCAEIVSALDPDGFFFDIQYFDPWGCFCESCRRKFLERFGYALEPAALNSTQSWLDVHQFQRESRKAFILGTVEACRTLKPGLTFSWNGCGHPIRSQPDLDIEATFLTTEAHPPHYAECVAKSKWSRASGKPFELTTPETIHSWGDWTLIDPQTLRGLCSIAVAHGGCININVTPIPCGDYGGRAFAPVYDTVREAMQMSRRLEPFCRDTQSVPVAAVLHSVENTALGNALDLKRRHRPQDPRGNEAVGHEYSFLASHVLGELQIPTDFLYHEGALDRIDEYELVVLPNVGFMRHGTADRLREYVAAGGALLATYNTSLLDAAGSTRDNFLLSDVLGVDFQGYSEHSVIYLDRFAEAIGGSLPAMPLLIKDAGYNEEPMCHAAYCTCRGEAEALAFFTEPAIKTDLAAGYHIYHDHAPPGRKTDIPAIVRNRFGKGQSVFMPFEFFQTWNRYGGVWLGKLLRATLSVLGRPRAAHITASPCVTVVLEQNAQGWLLHLLHLQKENRSPLLDADARSGPVRCILRPPWAVGAVREALTGQTIEFSRKDDGIHFAVDDVRGHAILAVVRSDPA